MRTHADAFGPGALGQLVPGPPALNIIIVSWNTFGPVEVQRCKNTRVLIEMCALPPESNILKGGERNKKIICTKEFSSISELL